MAEMSEGQRKAAFLIIELAEIGIAPSEIFGQTYASLVESGMSEHEVIVDMAGGMNRAAELMARPEQIWDHLVPGGGRPPEWEVVEAGGPVGQSVKAEFGEHAAAIDELVTKQKKYTNIFLAYQLSVHIGDDVYHCPDGAEFFMDEHDIQWCKFKPVNGLNKNEEHMFRTDRTAGDGFYVTRPS